MSERTTCANCGKKFQSARSTARYCSPKCRLKSHRGVSVSQSRPRSILRVTRKSYDLIQRMYEIAEAARPINGRGVGYKLFVAGLISSMSEMPRVYRLLTKARDAGIIPWEWIVDETRAVERIPSWGDPEEFAQAAARQYRLDFWAQQPMRCEVWSEKGTVRGVLKPVLDQYGVGFSPVHGFNSNTNMRETANGWDPRPLIILYVGDYDPSGMCMSERDLPKRFEKYDGDHITIKRIALTEKHVRDDAFGSDGLPSFPASDKCRDPRYRWFVENYGDTCWELDAMDPNDLRDTVETHIDDCIIDRDAWARCEVNTDAQRESLEHVLSGWAGKPIKG